MRKAESDLQKAKDVDIEKPDTYENYPNISNAVNEYKKAIKNLKKAQENLEDASKAMTSANDDFTAANRIYDAALAALAFAKSDLEAFKATVYLDLNGGMLPDGRTGTVQIDNLYIGEDSITLPTPSRKGYKLLYWKGSRYNPGDRYNISEKSHTLVAVWEKSDDTNIKDNSNSSAPRTGDTAALIMYEGMGLISLGAYLALRRRQR